MLGPQAAVGQGGRRKLPSKPKVIVPDFIIRYSGPGTHVRRTEAIGGDDVMAVSAHAKRSFATSRTFCAVDICGAPRLPTDGRPRRPARAGGGGRRQSRGKLMRLSGKEPTSRRPQAGHFEGAKTQAATMDAVRLADPRRRRRRRAASLRSGIAKTRRAGGNGFVC